MNNIVVIDSHKGTPSLNQKNLHWINAKIVADYLGADFVWSYPNHNDLARSGYDVMIFVHTSAYCFTDIKWLELNPNAKVFYITNEYNLGEPMVLYNYLKKNPEKKYDVIANYGADTPTRITKKYVDKHHFINLNALVYSPKKIKSNYLSTMFDMDKCDIVYYGAVREDRAISFSKFLKNIVVSTHKKNIPDYQRFSENCEFVKRIDWSNEGLSNYKMSLYMEDEFTKTHYNNLANRFYECLNYNCVPIFDIECKGTVEKSGYNIPDKYFVTSHKDFKEKIEMWNAGELTVLDEWHEMAKKERATVLTQIYNVVLN